MQAQKLWLAQSRSQGPQQLWSTGLAVPWHVTLPRPETEPAPSALAGGLLPTAPPGRSCAVF